MWGFDDKIVWQIILHCAKIKNIGLKIECGNSVEIHLPSASYSFYLNLKFYVVLTKNVRQIILHCAKWKNMKSQIWVWKFSWDPFTKCKFMILMNIPSILMFCWQNVCQIILHFAKWKNMTPQNRIYKSSWDPFTKCKFLILVNIPKIWGFVDKMCGK